MHQTICQKCGTANHTDAIICTECGVKLAHPERNTVAKIRKSSLAQSVAAAPGRLFKWTFRHLFALLVTLLSLAAVGCCCLYLLLFIPLTWNEYPKPAEDSSKEKSIQQKINILLASSGTFTAEEEELRLLGHELIFCPPDSKKRPVPKKAAEDEKYFTFIKLPHDRFGLVLYQKFYGKLPFRVLVVFAARREQGGQLQLDNCRLGNLPASANLTRKVAEHILKEWNPNQQLLTAFDRITRGEMVLDRNGQDNALRLFVSDTRN